VNRVLLVIALGVVAFGITLAVFVGSRLSNEAMAVLTGAVCGVGAVLPATILGSLALWRRRDTLPSPYYPAPSGYGPPDSPVVVMPPALSDGNPISNWPNYTRVASGSNTGGRVGRHDNSARLSRLFGGGG